MTSCSRTSWPHSGLDQPPWGSHSSSFFSFLKKNAHIFLKISFLQFFFNLCTQVWNSHHEARTPPLLCAYLCHSCWGDSLLSSSVFSSVSFFLVLFGALGYFLKTLITILTIENLDFWQSLFIWHLIVTLDSIRNSCDVLFLIPKDLNGECHSYPAEKQELSGVVFNCQDCLTWMSGLCDLGVRIVSISVTCVNSACLLFLLWLWVWEHYLQELIIMLILAWSGSIIKMTIFKSVMTTIMAIMMMIIKGILAWSASPIEPAVLSARGQARTDGQRSLAILWGHHRRHHHHHHHHHHHQGDNDHRHHRHLHQCGSGDQFDCPPVLITAS